MVRSRLGLGEGRRSLESVGWVESMKGVAVILSYQQYNQERKNGKGQMAKDKISKARVAAKASRGKESEGKKTRVK